MDPILDLRFRRAGAPRERDLGRTSASVFRLALALGCSVLHERAGPWLRRVDNEVAKGEISFLLVMRLIPAIPFFIANLAPAFVNVRLGNFIWTTFVGIAPATIVISSVGAGLAEVLDQGGEPNIGVIFEAHILLPLLGLAALAALPAVLRKLHER